jgi:hypothetical protein
MVGWWSRCLEGQHGHNQVQPEHRHFKGKAICLVEE